MCKGVLVSMWQKIGQNMHDVVDEIKGFGKQMSITAHAQ